MLRAVCAVWTAAFPTVRVQRGWSMGKDLKASPAAGSWPRPLFRGAGTARHSPLVRHLQSIRRRARANDDSFADEWIHAIIDDDDGQALAAARTFVGALPPWFWA